MGRNKQTVVDAKCKLSKEECKNVDCPVHGQIAELTKDAVELDIDEEVGRALSLPAELPLAVVEVLKDAREVVKHIHHPNEFTRELVERIGGLIDPPAPAEAEQEPEPAAEPVTEAAPVAETAVDGEQAQAQE